MNWSARLHHWIFITITKNSLTVIKKYVTDFTILKVIIAMNVLSILLSEWSLRIFCAAIVYFLFIPVSLVVFCSIVVTSVLILLLVKIQFFVTTRGYNIRDVRNWLPSSSLKCMSLGIESPLVRIAIEDGLVTSHLQNHEPKMRFTFSGIWLTIIPESALSLSTEVPICPSLIFF